MDKYTVVETQAILEGEGKFWEVLDPLGNVVYGAQQPYMAKDRAYSLNEDTRFLRDELATMQTALETQSEEIARLRKALEEIANWVPLRVSTWTRDASNLAIRLDGIYKIVSKALSAQEESEEQS